MLWKYLRKRTLEDAFTRKVPVYSMSQQSREFLYFNNEVRIFSQTKCLKYSVQWKLSQHGALQDLDVYFNLLRKRITISIVRDKIKKVYKHLLQVDPGWKEIIF